MTPEAKYGEDTGTSVAEKLMTWDETQRRHFVYGINPKLWTVGFTVCSLKKLHSLESKVRELQGQLDAKSTKWQDLLEKVKELRDPNDPDGAALADS
jgi:hypothetical protein